MEEKKADEDLTTMDEANKPTISESPSKLSSSFVSYGPNLHVSNHPVLAHKLSILRSSSTSPSSFRSTLREITFHLGYEATSSLSTREIPITVPGTNHTDHIEAIGSKISQKIALIPILRSGLGMVDSMLELVGDARVHHIGMYRSKSLMPVQYYNRLPKKCEVDVAYILDPLIATSATIISVASILKKWGVPKIHVISVIASKQGLTELISHNPDLHVTLGHIDEELNADGDVLPGLGDSGDRLFGTGPVEEDEEGLVHPSKRKRSGSLASEASCSIR